MESRIHLGSGAHAESPNMDPRFTTGHLKHCCQLLAFASIAKVFLFVEVF